MPIKPIAAIEIGTTQTIALLGTYSPRMDGSIDVTSFCTEKTSGMRKSEVQTAQSVSTTADGILQKLSKKGRTDINRINLIYSGGNLHGDPILGRTTISNASEVVEEEDVNAAIADMRASQPPSGRTTLEEMKIGFILDGTRAVEDPCTLSASELVVNGIRTHVDTNSYRALLDAVEDSGCTVDNVFSAACCAPLGCTTTEQRRHGVLVIDLGGGTTSWSVLHSDRIIAVGHLAVGGDHVTNDILCAFHTGSDESATALKHEHAQTTLEGIDPTVRIDLPKNIGMVKTINLKALSIVVNARMDETIRIIHADLAERGLLDGLGAGIVLCGGGSMMVHITSLVSRIFNRIPCVVGKLPYLNIPEIDEDPYNIRYATCYGALLRAARIEAEHEEQGGGFRLKNLFRRAGVRR